jgi:hypothetical protein
MDRRGIPRRPVLPEPRGGQIQAYREKPLGNPKTHEHETACLMTFHWLHERKEPPSGTPFMPGGGGGWIEIVLNWVFPCDLRYGLPPMYKSREPDAATAASVYLMAPTVKPATKRSTNRL